VLTAERVEQLRGEVVSFILGQVVKKEEKGGDQTLKRMPGKGARSNVNEGCEKGAFGLGAAKRGEENTWHYVGDLEQRWGQSHPPERGFPKSMVKWAKYIW